MSVHETVTPIPESEGRTPPPAPAPQPGGEAETASPSGAAARTPTRLLGAVTVMLALIIAYAVRGLLLPILLALFLAILLRPGVAALRRLKLPDSLGAAVVTAAFVGICLGGGYYLSTPLQSWIERGASIPYQTEQKLEKLRTAAVETVEDIASGTAGVSASSDAETNEGGGGKALSISVGEIGAYLLGTVTSVTLTFLTVSVLLFFFLALGSRMSRNFVDGFRDPQLAERTRDLFADMSERIAVYFQIVTLINIGLGLAAGTALSLLGLPNPVFWGTVVGVMNFLPFVGPTVSVIAIGVASLLSLGSWGEIVLPPLAIVLLNGVEAQLITPALVGRRLRFNPLAVVVSIMVGAWIWGLIGAILAVPILATIKLVLEHFDILRPVNLALR